MRVFSLKRGLNLGVMAQAARDYAVLHVDDCLNDQLLVQEAARLSQPRLVFIPIGTFGSAVSYLSGTGAFAAREQFPMPDLLLLDWKLESAETGLDLLRWVRARKELSTLPVVMYSGSAGGEQVRACYLSGANHFLVKTSEFARLVPILTALEQFLISVPTCSDLLRHLPEYRPAPEGILGAASCPISEHRPIIAPFRA